MYSHMKNMFLQKVGVVQAAHTGQMSKQEDVEMTTEDVLMHDERQEKDITSTLVKLKKIKLALLSDIVRVQPLNHFIGHAQRRADSA
jgi:hypothetical protein